MGGGTEMAGRRTARPRGQDRRACAGRVGEALRNLPPFLKLVWQDQLEATNRRERHKRRLIRALLPSGDAVRRAKLIIDEVVLPHAAFEDRPNSLSGW